MLLVVSRINPDLVIAFDPVPILIMGGDPDVFPPFRNPDPLYFPMARRLAYYGWRMMNGPAIMVMMRGDDGRRMAILEQIIEGHRPKPDGHSLPASLDPFPCKGKGYRVEEHPDHQQPNNNPPFHDRVTSSFEKMSNMQNPFQHSASCPL
jgi:hypothetical protein